MKRLREASKTGRFSRVGTGGFILLSIFAALLFLGFSVTPSLAADLPLQWNAVEGATGYKIYMSLDGGTTWDGGIDIGPGNPVNGDLAAVYVGAPETGMVLFKIGAYKSGGETVTDWQGVWYDHTRRPLGYTTGMGIN